MLKHWIGKWKMKWEFLVIYAWKYNGFMALLIGKHLIVYDSFDI